MFKAFTFICLFLLAPLPLKAEEAPIVEVIHFWISPSEKSAIDVVANTYREDGGVWTDTVATTENDLRVFLSNQIINGYSPALFQWHGGMELQGLAEQDHLNTLSPEVFDTLSAIPPFVLENVSYQDQVVAVPLGLHSENWMWYNLEIYKELNLELPTTWDEFLLQAETISAAGYLPLAIGERWQHQLLLNTILAGILGKKNYIDFFVNRNAEQIETDAFRKSIDIYLNLKKYFASATARTWQDATNLVAHKQAAAQCMGDWAKTALLKSNKIIDKDFACRLAPETEDSLVLVIDALAFAANDDPKILNAQREIAKIATSKEVQIEFNKRKGSLPIRNDIDFSNEDPCVTQAARNISRNNLIPSMSMLWPNAFGSLVTELIILIDKDAETDAERYQQLLYKKALVLKE